MIRAVANDEFAHLSQGKTVQAELRVPNKGAIFITQITAISLLKMLPVARAAARWEMTSSKSTVLSIQRGARFV
jgi:hypothetical protein